MPYSIEVTANGYGFETECGTRYELLFYRIHPDYPIYSFSIEYARFRLFDKWYQPHRKDFYREVYCKDVYYSSVIARRDNPLANEMSKWFVGLMSEMIDNI